MSQETLISLVKNDDFDGFVKEFDAEKFKPNELIIYPIIHSSRNKEFLSFLNDKGKLLYDDINLLGIAAQKKDVSLLKLLYDYGFKQVGDYCTQIAFDYGDLECVKWFVEKGCPLDRRAYALAAKHKDVLDFMNGLDCDKSEWDYDDAYMMAKTFCKENMKFFEDRNKE